MEQHVDFDRLIEQIPYERKLSDYNLHPRSVVNSNTHLHVPKPKYRFDEQTLEQRFRERDVCLISPVPIDDRYIACRINLNKKSNEGD